MLTRTFATIGIIAVSFSATAFADTYHHIDQLACTIARQANQLVHESRHYRHTAEYRHLVCNANDMADLADHLHEIAIHHGSLAHMQVDVARLYAKFHHLESIFDRIERRVALGHGYGHIHGNTRHVKELLCSIEDNIRYLQADLRSLRAAVHPVAPTVVARPPIYSIPQYGSWGRNVPSRGYLPDHLGQLGGHRGHDFYRHRSSGRGGITIGGGSTRFTIRF